MKARQDLYWQWAEATNFAAYGDMPPKGYVVLLIECAEGKFPKDLQRWLKPRGAHQKGFVPGPYLKLKRRFCTAWVERQSIEDLPGEIVKRFQLGLPKVDRSARLQTQDIWTETAFPTGCKALLAVIDDAINIAHPTFMNSAGQSRFKIFWDQSTNTAIGSRKPNFGYKLLPNNTPPKFNLRTASHGTHVASLAGGVETPQYRLRHSRLKLAQNNAFDHASSTVLAGVALPNRTVLDTSGGALAVNVLDALTFLEMNTPEEVPVVVNLSFGIMAGPHDGSSIFDAALDEVFARRKGKLTVVMPAGNSFEMQCHAKVEVKKNQSELLVWRILPDDQTPNFVEIWLPKDSNAQISLQSPDGRHTMRSTVMVDIQKTPNSAVPFAVILRSNNPANGDAQLVLLAINPTKERSDDPSAATTRLPVAPHGDWKIVVDNPQNDSITARVWIERDNASFGHKALGRQSYFVDPQALRKPERAHFLNKSAVITGYGSLNGIACSVHPVVAGGYDVRTGMPARASGSGSSDSFIRCPDGIAPSDESRLVLGLPGAAHSGGGVVHINGTSVAAPLVSRFFVNLLMQNLAVKRPPAVRQDTAHGYDEIEGGGRLSL